MVLDNLTESQAELVKKLKLKDEHVEKLDNIEFKKEHLGALEFDLTMTDAEFNDSPVHFRLERVPAETFLKIVNKDKLNELMPESLKNFIALPLEAKKLDFFNYDTDALMILSNIITSFQATPSIFR